MLSELSRQNPWWVDPGAIERDPLIEAWEGSRLRWDPRIRHTFELESDAVYTLRGPRQIGKSTTLKLMIRDLLSRGVEPQRIFYYSCDLVESPRRLLEVLRSYLDWARRLTRERLYLFLDEVSSVRDWQLAVKQLADLGELRGCTLVLTGSHSLDVKRSSERMPGRRGQASTPLDKIMLPMKFAEYVETLDEEIAGLLRREGLLSRSDRLRVVQEVASGDLPPEVDLLAPLVDRLNSLFESYLITGGMPRAVNEFLSRGSISSSAYRVYVDFVIGDLTRWGLQELYLRQVIRAVIETSGSPVSWVSLRERTDLGSHVTVQRYVEALEASFVLLRLYHINSARSGPDPRKNKKLYIRDPFLFHALRGWVTSSDPYEESLRAVGDPEFASKLVEGVVADHLVRLAFAASEAPESFECENFLLYWRGKGGREVDFVLRLRSRWFPVEVKFQRSVGRSDLAGVLRFRGGGGRGGIVLTRDLLGERSGVSMVPTSLFLLLV